MLLSDVDDTHFFQRCLQIELWVLFCWCLRWKCLYSFENRLNSSSYPFWSHDGLGSWFSSIFYSENLMNTRISLSFRKVQAQDSLIYVWKNCLTSDDEFTVDDISWIFNGNNFKTTVFLMPHQILFLSVFTHVYWFNEMSGRWKAVESIFCNILYMNSWKASGLLEIKSYMKLNQSSFMIEPEAILYHHPFDLWTKIIE